MQKKYISLGLMSGTSGDGVDASIIESNGINLIKQAVPNLAPNDLRSLAAQVNKRAAPSVVLLASEANGKCGLICLCSPEAVEAGHQAGKYLGELATKLGGKGGGKPDFAMGGAPAGNDIKDALAGISLSSTEG